MRFQLARPTYHAHFSQDFNKNSIFKTYVHMCIYCEILNCINYLFVIIPYILETICKFICMTTNVSIDL